jgi:hypothetical protein
MNLTHLVKSVCGQVTVCVWSNDGIWSPSLVETNSGMLAADMQMKILDFELATNFDAQKLRRFALLN